MGQSRARIATVPTRIRQRILSTSTHDFHWKLDLRGAVHPAPLLIECHAAPTPNGLKLPVPRSFQGAARPRLVRIIAPPWPGPLSEIPHSLRGSEWLGSLEVRGRMRCQRLILWSKT